MIVKRNDNQQKKCSTATSTDCIVESAHSIITVKVPWRAQLFEYDFDDDDVRDV